MNEHPLVRAVGIVLRARDPRGAPALLASLEQWLSAPRTGRPSNFDCWMCKRYFMDVGVFTNVIPEEDGTLTWEIGGRSSSPRVAMCDVCVGGCHVARDPSGEDAVLGHILAALQRGGEEALGGKVAEAYARLRLWSGRGIGTCVSCRHVRPRVGTTDAVALCEECLGRFKVSAGQTSRKR